MNKTTIANINKSNQSCLVGKIHKNQIKTTKSEHTQNSLKIFSSTGVKTINLFSKCKRNSEAKSQISKEDHTHQMRELNNLRSSKKTQQFSRTKTCKNIRSDQDTSQILGANKTYNLFSKKKTGAAKVDLIKIRSNQKNAIKMIDINLDHINK